MIELPGVIQLRDNRGQLDPETPLVGAASHLLDPRAPPIPPTRNESGNRLDDEQAIAGIGALKQPLDKLVAGRIGQLVQSKGREDQRRSLRQRHRCDVAFNGASRQPESTIGPHRFAKSPRVTVNPDDTRRMPAGGCPGRPCRPGAAPEINERCRRRCAQSGWQGLHDRSHEQKVQRPIKERKRGAFPPAVEGTAIPESLATFDVRSRQRAKPRRHLRKRKVGQMLLLCFSQPKLESIVVGHKGVMVSELLLPTDSPFQGGFLMQTVRKLVTFTVAVLIAAAPTSALADGRHVADPAMIAAAVAQHVDQQDADRAAIHEALARPQVRDMAGRMGLDVGRATAVVDTLAGPDLTRAAGAARQVNQQLVGGATTVVITTTTVIIALLILIILIVALK